MNDPQENCEKQNVGTENSKSAGPESQPIEGPEVSADLDQRLAQAEKQIEFYKDQLLRKVADFDNFKRRAEAESASVFKYAKADIIQELLPVIDDFERSLKLARDRRDSEAFAKGVELIYQKLAKFLQTQGVREIESLGKEFDVHFHDALLQVPRSDVPPHVVIEVVDKGYTLDDRVLRHAKVVVSTSPAGESADKSKEGKQSTGPDATTKIEN
ncbi:MAG: nucleotide exchange factor GrpE [Ignavibacteriales bacterium]|nr:nucleotide exchange factor GrpE [Ignavibacteriales bacterium]